MTIYITCPHVHCRFSFQEDYYNPVAAFPSREELLHWVYNQFHEYDFDGASTFTRYRTKFSGTRLTETYIIVPIDFNTYIDVRS